MNDKAQDRLVNHTHRHYVLIDSHVLSSGTSGSCLQEEKCKYKFRKIQLLCKNLAGAQAKSAHEQRGEKPVLSKMGKGISRCEDSRIVCRMTANVIKMTRPISVGCALRKVLKSRTIGIIL